MYACILYSVIKFEHVERESLCDPHAEDHEFHSSFFLSKCIHDFDTSRKESVLPLSLLYKHITTTQYQTVLKCFCLDRNKHILLTLRDRQTLHVNNINHRYTTLHIYLPIYIRPNDQFWLSTTSVWKLFYRWWEPGTNLTVHML